MSLVTIQTFVYAEYCFLHFTKINSEPVTTLLPEIYFTMNDFWCFFVVVVSNRNNIYAGTIDVKGILPH